MKNDKLQDDGSVEPTVDSRTIDNSVRVSVPVPGTVYGSLHSTVFQNTNTNAIAIAIQ